MHRKLAAPIAPDLWGNERALSLKDVGQWTAKPRTLVDELRTLRAYMEARDRDPLHAWNPPRILAYGGRNADEPKHANTREYATGRRLWEESLTRYYERRSRET